MKRQLNVPLRVKKMQSSLDQIHATTSITKTASLSSHSSSTDRSSFSSSCESFQNNTERRVSFDSVKIRAYSLTLGDNPSCKEWPALSLDWNYEQYDKLPIDTFETFRKQTRRGSNAELKIPSQTRNDLLKYLDVSEEEIITTQMEVQIIKLERSRTKRKEKKKRRRRRRMQALFQYIAKSLKTILSF